MYHLFAWILPFHIVVAMEDAPSTLYPPLALSAYAFRVVELIHRQLFKINERLEPEPDLVESYSVDYKNDHMVFFVNLKKKQRTCFGKDINSEMVVSSFKKFKEYGRLRLIRAIEVIGNYALKIIAEKSFLSIYDLVFPVFPEDWTDCTGDFQIVDFSPGYSVLLKSRVNGKTLMVKGVKNDITRVLEFEKGDIDILVNSVPPHLFHYVSSLKNVDIITRSSINISYVALNTRNKFLSINEVRQAIFYAIDREKIITEVLNGLGDVVNSMIPSLSYFYCDCANYKYDPIKALELLEKSGFSRKDGYFFKLTWKTSTVKQAIRVVKSISSYLEKVGIKVEIFPQEFHKFFSDIIQGNYEIFSLNLVGITSPDVLRFIAHSESFPPKGANRVFFSNPYFDQIIGKAERQEDAEKAKEFYKHAQEILMDGAVYIPIYQVKDIIAYRKEKVSSSKIKKAKFIPGGSLSFVRYILD